MNVMQLFDVCYRYQTNGDLGIEVEVEGDNLPCDYDVDSYWNVEYDGSLIGESNEYVLNRPIKVGDVDNALMELSDAYEECETEVSDSVRAGVHVHVNVQELSIPQLYNFFTLYSMFEGAMLAYCGVGREGNLFCLPLNKSADLIHKLRSVAVRKNYYTLVSDEYRYCAMNVKALGTYGSLEFRALRSTEDLTKVGDWAKLLLHLRDVACSYDSPEHLMVEASILGSIRMFNKCIGPYNYMFSDVMNLKRRLSSGIRSAQAIAYSCDWNVYNEGVVYEDFC